MTARQDIEALLARVKQATEPDRQIDQAFVDVFGKWSANGVPSCAGILGIGGFTSSIDHIRGLIKEALPEANCCGFDEEPNYIEAYISRNNVLSGHWLITGTGATVPLAFCAAFLAARLNAPAKAEPK